MSVVPCCSPLWRIGPLPMTMTDVGGYHNGSPGRLEDQMMNYQLNPLTSHETGAEVIGLDLKAPVGAELRRALNAEFAKYHVLVFRDQKMTAAEFARAGGIFGELMPHHHKDVRADGHPEVYEVRNQKLANGEFRIQGGTFHTDHSNH